MSGFSLDGGAQRVLFVTSAGAPEAVEVLRDLEALDPLIEVGTAVGAAAALDELRSWSTYGVVFLGPGLPHNESLALIATLRRDRAPVAIVPIITDAERQFLAPAISAGADDVVIWRDGRLIEIEDTLRRIRHSRHVDPGADGPKLLVLYAGQDPLARDLLHSMPFVHSAAAECGQDGALSLVMPDGEAEGQRADVLVVDEPCGRAHMLEVVKWVRARVPDLPIVALTPPAGGEVGGAALDMGADDAVSKAGTYRRRFVAVLHRLLMRRDTPGNGAAAAAEPTAPGPAPVPAWVNQTSERDDLKQALEDADTELTEVRSELTEVRAELAGARAEIEAVRRELTDARAAAGTARVAQSDAEKARDSLRDQLASMTADLVRLQAERAAATEARAFDRALRDRDQEEIATLHRDLGEARERLAVLEQTLRRTEDDAAERLAVLERERAAERRGLERQVADAADRLHAVATNTQDLHAELERQVAAAQAARDRLTDTRLFGHAVFSEEGELLRCSDTFAEMFGYPSAADAVSSTAGGPFPGTIDHDAVRAALADRRPIDREESTVRHADGRPFRVLMSATRVEREGGEAQIERLFVDLRDSAALEAELRLARRLESAGRLAAEMTGDIERGLAGFEHGAATADDRARTLTYIRQLLAYGRRQARPAGYLSLNDAIRRAEPRLRALAGDGIDLQLRLGDTEHIAAGEEDVEQLLADMVLTLAGCLPYGGSLVLETASVTSGFVLSTRLSAIAAGYGVLPVRTTPSLTRHASRCAGVIRTAEDAAHTSALHIILPS
jgi:DNA-binding NarL/FixJ family response regulator/predicted  nucleic acid-binding Zn-ribbon protein